MNKLGEMSSAELREKIKELKRKLEMFRDTTETIGQIVCYTDFDSTDCYSHLSLKIRVANLKSQALAHKETIHSLKKTFDERTLK